MAFPSLFNICENPQALVADLVEEGEWLLSFRRNLNSVRLEQLQQLREMLEEVQLGEEQDEVI